MRFSAISGGQSRAVALTLMLLLASLLATIPLPEAEANNTTSEAWSLSTGYNYQYVCENDNFDYCDAGDYGSGVDVKDYWKYTFHQGDYFVVTLYDYCNPHMAVITLRYYTPAIGWNSVQSLDCDTSAQVSRTVSGSTYGTYYFEVVGLDGWGGDATDYRLHLSLDTTDRDQDRDGYKDSNDDCISSYGSSNLGSYYGCPDSDGDGWADLEDEFPTDSSEHADYDGDGYGDNGDEFPYDASEWSDLDGDGVGDNSDTFPDDPSEQRDSDGDGTGDNSDPTPYGGQSVTDMDDDGVRDEDDACPSTSSGASVDLYGCSASQRDSDGDGVSDADDLCQNTPAGQSVTSSGCGSSQRDTDADGVSDDRDLCAGTPLGTTVDSNGCTAAAAAEDLVEDYAPTLYMDARECFLPVSRHYDDMDVSNNYENYWDGRVDSNVCAISYQSGVSHDFTVYTNIVEEADHYVFEYWYYYADSRPKGFGSIVENSGQHEHDYEWVFVWVDKSTLNPFYLATSQHYWMNEYFITSTSEIWAQVEWGGHGMIHNTGSQIHYAKGDGITIRPWEQTFVTMSSRSADLSGLFLKGDACDKDYQCKAPWLQPVYSYPDDWIYNTGAKGVYSHNRGMGALVGWLNSPAEHHIIDSGGNRTGVVDGEVVEEIPYSWYNADQELIIVLGGLEEYQVVVNGLEDGVYGLNISEYNGTDTVEFNATAIPTTANESHVFTVDAEILAAGGEGVQVSIDANGNGTFERTLNVSGSISGEDLVIPAPDDEPGPGTPVSDTETSSRNASKSLSTEALMISIGATALFIIIIFVAVVLPRRRKQAQTIVPPSPHDHSASVEVGYQVGPAATVLSSQIIAAPPSPPVDQAPAPQPIPVPMPTPPVQTPPSGKQCMVCGQTNHPDARDCMFCWSSLE